MSDAIPITTELVEHVSQTAGDSVTDEQVLHVLAAFNDVTNGDPVGTIKTNSEGALAFRVNVGGVHKWMVTNADGSGYEITMPTLPEWDPVPNVGT